MLWDSSSIGVCMSFLKDIRFVYARAHAADVGREMNEEIFEYMEIIYIRVLYT